MAAGLALCTAAALITVTIAACYAVINALETAVPVVLQG